MNELNRSPASLLAQLLEEQLQAWSTGQPVAVEEYLRRHPQLAEHPDALLDLIVQECICRKRGGEMPTADELYRRFPTLTYQLGIQLAFLEQLGSSLVNTASGHLSTVPLKYPPSPSISTTSEIPGYRDLALLGRGGMGVVYRAWQESVGRVVALKMLRASGEDEIARFRAEAEAVGRLQHPNIVQIFAVGEHAGAPFLVLEYVAGGNLSEHLHGTPLPADRAARLTEILSRAIHHAHQCGVIHRDLKPANVLMAVAQSGSSVRLAAEPSAQREPTAPAEEEWTPKVTDFGLARRLEAADGLTATGAIMGTPSYMAPEQAAGAGKLAGPSADVYALGVILYECLTGRPPFRAATSVETLLQVVRNEPVPPRRLQPGVPRDLETICLKCLEKEPAKRYASAELLAEDLRRFQAHEPIQARPAGPLERANKWARRRPAVAGLLAALLVVVTGSLIGLTILWQRAAQARDDAVQQQALTRAAEKQVRNKLAEAHIQAARLAMRQGEWRTVLYELDSAKEAGYPDRSAISLMKVRAWESLHEVAQAQAELDRLLQLPIEEEYQGQILLLRADFMLAENASDEKALQLVRDALAAKTLAPADESYALGLLADSTVKAAAHFENAVRADPFHHRANAMLGLLLIMLGRNAEAGDRIRYGELLFPEDPTFTVLDATLQSMQNDLPAARKVLAKARQRLGPEQFEAAGKLIEMVQQFRQIERVLTEVSTGQGGALAKAKLAQSLLGYVMAVPRGRNSLFMPVPPVLIRALSQTAAALPTILFGGAGADDALAKAEAIHPDALLYFLHGMVLSTHDEWADAAKHFQSATESSSILPIHSLSLFCLASAQWMQTIDEQAPHRDELLKQALGNVRKVVAAGGYGTEQAATLACIAIDAKDLDLARWILTQQQKQEPDHLGLLRQRLRVEYRAGDYAQAIQIIDKILAQVPDDPTATRTRGLALERLQKQTEAAKEQPTSTPPK